MKTLETRIESMENDLKAIKAALGLSCEAAPKTDALVVPTSISLKRYVIVCLKQIGVPSHLLGYEYLQEAIIMVVNDRNVINAVTKVLYSQVAKAFGTTPSRVERAIRHAIEIAWDRGDMDTLYKFFGNTVSTTKGKPTNSEFIAMLSEYIKMKGDNNEMD